MELKIASTIFTFLTLLVIIFQILLALGLPWGSASMGGKFPGKYPPYMRFIALLNALLLSLINLAVLVHAGLIFDGPTSLTKMIIWPIIIFFLVGAILNTITPSKIERIWAPVAFLQLISCIIIALG